MLFECYSYFSTQDNNLLFGFHSNNARFNDSYQVWDSKETEKKKTTREYVALIDSRLVQSSPSPLFNRFVMFQQDKVLANDQIFFSFRETWWKQTKMKIVGNLQLVATKFGILMEWKWRQQNWFNRRVICNSEMISRENSSNDKIQRF